MNVEVIELEDDDDTKSNITIKHHEDKDDNDDTVNLFDPLYNKKRRKQRMTSEELEKSCASLLQANKGIERNIIYCDPPWSFINDGWQNVPGLASSHYETMHIDDLKALPVKQICAKNSVCVMWTCSTLFVDAINLMNAWGFEYLTMFMVWVKTYKNEIRGLRQGFYTRQFAEYVLLGKRKGSCCLKLRRNPCPYVPNVFHADTTEHSRKPVYVKETIDRIFKDLPRIELFARQSTDANWDYWGNETTKFGTSFPSLQMTTIRNQQIQNAKELITGSLHRDRDEGNDDGNNSSEQPIDIDDLLSQPKKQKQSKLSDLWSK